MNYKSIREDMLKYTLDEFAEFLGVEVSQISAWEKDPSSVRQDIAQMICEKTGLTLAALAAWRKPTPRPLEVNGTWEITAEFTKHSLSNYIAAALEKADIPLEQRKAYVDDLREGIASNIVKPRVMIVGRSDTGKSTLINGLLGSDKLHADWTPMTSIAVYIKHIEDKPEFIKEDVWVFGNRGGNDDLWNERYLYDEDYCLKWKIAGGDADILRSYGNHDGNNHGENADAAVMFIDAPLLKNCDIVDLPGFGTVIKNDDDISDKTAHRADVIIYLSLANGFMIDDVNHIQRRIIDLPIFEKNGENNLKPLANLFIVASQAHTIEYGRRDKLKMILDKGCANFWETLPDKYWEKRQEVSGYLYDEEELRSRFFTYTTDIKDLCVAFEDELRKLLETLPAIVDSKAKKFVADYIKTRKLNLANELDKYEGLLTEREKYIDLLKAIDESEVERAQDNDTQKADVRAEIKRLNDDSVQKFVNYSATLINQDAIVQLLERKKVKNKEADIKLFVNLLQNMLQQQAESILESNSKLLSHKIEKYIKKYSENISSVFDKSNVKVDFDASWEFASILGKIGLVGGLGALGIFLALRGALGFAGMFFGNVAGLGAFLGPIGIALGVILSLVYAFFGGSWEENIAKKIVAAFEENDINGKYRTAMRKFWQQTETAFNNAAKALDVEWTNYVIDLRNLVNSYDIDEIQHKIASLKVLSVFFDNIPL